MDEPNNIAYTLGEQGKRRGRRPKLRTDIQHDEINNNMTRVQPPTTTTPPPRVLVIKTKIAVYQLNESPRCKSSSGTHIHTHTQSWLTRFGPSLEGGRVIVDGTVIDMGSKNVEPAEEVVVVVHIEEDFPQYFPAFQQV